MGVQHVVSGTTKKGCHPCFSDAATDLSDNDHSLTSKQA